MNELENNQKEIRMLAIKQCKNFLVKPEGKEDDQEDEETED